MKASDHRLAEPVAAKESLSGTVLRGGGWLGMAALLQTLLQILIFAVLARLLSPTDFGLVAIAGIFIDLAAGIATMGTSQALVQRPFLTVYHIRASFWISLIMGLAMTGALFASSNWLAALLNSPSSAPLMAALALTFAIRALGSVPEGLATRRLQFRVLAVRQLVAYSVGYGVVGVASALGGAEEWTLVFAQVTQVSVATLLMIIAVRFDIRPTLKRSAYRDILGFGSGFSVARIANSLANQVDRVVVSMNTPPAAVGLYTRALQVSRYPTTLIGQVIEDVLFPSFASAQNDRKRLANAYYRSIGAIFTVLTPTSVFFCISAPAITSLLLGRQWGGAATMMVAFGAAIPFRSAQRVSSALLRSVGRSWLVAAMQTFLFIATTAGALVGIKYGLVATAVAVTLAFILHYVALAVACMLTLSIKPQLLLLRHLSGLPVALIVATGAAIGTGAGSVGLIPSLVGLLVSIIICFTLAVGAIWFRPSLFLGSDGQWLNSLLVSRLPRRWRSHPLLKFFGEKEPVEHR